MTPFAHQLAPANKSPTSTVNPDGSGNGQPGGQLDVGAGLSDAELRQHIQQQRTKSVAGLWPVGGAS